MKLEIASPESSPQLIDFYKDFTLKGMVDLKVDRRDFFAPYRVQSDHYKTYMLKDEDENIQATASFIFKDVFYQNQIIKVATATDLRVANNRHAILNWANHFLPVLKEVTESNGLSYVFSILNLSDSAALNAFVRPRNLKRPIPRYYLYRKFYLNTIHGRFPWAKPPLTSLRIERGDKKNVDQLINYLVFRARLHTFSSLWDKESFEKKIQRMQGFDLSHFLIAFDSRKNIVGCVAPWKNPTQDYIPLSYSLRAHNFRQFLKFCSWTGYTKKLTKPVASTGVHRPLKFRYLTHVNADNEDIFESLIWRASEMVGRDEFLIYANAEQDYRLMPPKNWITSQIPHALYTVVPPENETPAFLKPSDNLNPEIEACFI